MSSVVNVNISFLGQYLRRLKEFKNSGYKFVFLDETYVNVNHQPSREWINKDGEGRKVPIGKGKRIIVVHAGGDGGFLEGCECVFTSQHLDGRDYHSEMNSDIFEDWLIKRLLPSLNEPTCIVMDNASYHSVIHPNFKTPNSSNKKTDLIEWLHKQNIPCDATMLKPELIALVKKHKLPTVYQSDCIIREHGHEVLRLPPYHCDLNPIELIWSQVKGTVARRNRDFSLKSTAKLTDEAIKEVSVSDWNNAIAHVDKVVEQYMKNDGVRPRIDNIIIPLNEYSSSSSGSSSDEM